MLTAGGDCPGLNAVIRAATRRLLERDHEPVGLLRGYRGLARPGPADAARPPRRVGHPPHRRHDPVDLVARPVARARRRRARAGGPARGPARRAHRDRRRAHDDDHPADPRGARAARRRRAEDDRQRRRRHGLHLRVRHRRAGRDRRDRPAAHHRPVARPGDGPRGDGPQLGLDRRLLRPGRRRGRDRHPRARADRRGDHRGDRAPPPPRQGLLDRRRRRGRRAGVRVRGPQDDPGERGARRVRLPAARRHRRGARRRDRGPHRLRDARDDARARPARRHAHGDRPHPGDALRLPGGGDGDGRRDRPHGRAARHRDDVRAARPRWRASRRWTCASSSAPGRSSADEPALSFGCGWAGTS